MMKKFITFLIIITGCNVYGQTLKFQFTIGNTQTEIANSICQTSDGGFIIVGATYPAFTNADVYVVKLNSAGALEWTKTFGGSSNDIGHYVIETAGGYLIAGETESFSSSRDAFLVRTDLNGDTLWTKTYGGTGSDIANKIEELPSGTLLLSGSFQVNGVNQMALVRLSISGVILGQGYISPYQFASPINKAAYLGNGMVGFTGANPALVIADTNGTYVKTYSDFYSGRSVDAILTYDQKYVSVVYDNVGGPQGSNITLTKLDPLTASNLFTQKFSTNFDETPVSVVETDDRGFLILATSYTSFSSNQSLVLIKTDSLANNILWSKRYSTTPTEDNFEGQLIKTTDGGFAIAASTTVNGNFSNYDCYIIKTDSAGDSFCNQSAAIFTLTAATPVAGTLPTPLTYSIPNTGTSVAPVISSYGIPNTICTTVGIEIHENNSPIAVYPNPATDFVTMDLDQNFSEKNISLINSLGQIVFDKKNFKENQLTIDLAGFQNGIYLAKVESDNMVYTKKLVIQN